MLSKSLFFILVLLVDVSLSFGHQIEVDRKKIESKVLSRKKRFIIFPTGSSFSVAVCMTVGVYGNPQFSIFSWALNYGFAYNLPTNSTYFTHVPEDVFNLPFFDEPKDDIIEAPVTTPKAVESETFPADHDTPTFPPTGGEIHHHDESSRRKYHVYYQPSYETKPMIQRRYRREIYRNIESVIDKMGYHGRDCILQALCESPQIFNMKQKTMVQELIKTVFSFPKSKVLPFEHPELLLYDEAHRKGRSKIDCDGSYSKCGFSLIKMALGKYSKPQNSFM